MNKNKKGFSVVEVLVVIVILGLVGTVGWLVWDKQSSKNNKTTLETKLQKTEEKTVSTETKSDNKDYMVITEWNVRIPNDKIPVGFSYKLEGNVGRFRSKALNDVSREGCESNSINVARGKANDIPPSTTGSTETNFLETYEYLIKEDSSAEVTTTRDIHLKINDHYYVPPGYSGASCLINPNQQAQEDSAALNIAKALNYLEPLK